MLLTGLWRVYGRVLYLQTDTSLDQYFVHSAFSLEKSVSQHARTEVGNEHGVPSSVPSSILETSRTSRVDMCVQRPMHYSPAAIPPFLASPSSGDDGRHRHVHCNGPLDYIFMPTASDLSMLHRTLSCANDCSQTRAVALMQQPVSHD